MYFQAARTSHLYQMNADGSDLKQLLTNFHGNTKIQWSPRSGAWGLLTLQDENYFQSLYRMRPNGQQLRAIPNTSGVNEYAWSSDGHWIIYVADYHTLIGRIRVDGSQHNVPLNPAFLNVLTIRSFPNNQFLVEGTHQDFGRANYLIRLDGGIIERVESADSNRARLLSPDERWIAFSSGLPNKHDIFRLKSGGYSAVQLTHLPGDERFVAWSPDSQWLIFTSEPAEGKKYLYRMRWEGTNIQQLTPLSFVQEFQTFSLDGKWIYFDARTPGGFAMYRMRMNGNDLQRLTSDFENPLIFRSWSPQFERNWTLSILLALSLVSIGGGLLATWRYVK